MSNIDMIVMALRNLFKRKLRAFLTIIGVIIGTASIIITISLGLAVNVNFEEQLSQYGDVTKIKLYSDSYYQGGGGSEVKGIMDSDVDKISEIKGVQVATPVDNIYIYFKSGKYSVDGTNVIGVRPEAMSALGIKVFAGRVLEDGDSNFQIVLGGDTPGQFMTNKERQAMYQKSWDNRMMIEEISQGEGEKLPVDVFKDKIMGHFDWSYIAPTGGPDDYVDPHLKNFKPYTFDVIGVVEIQEYDYETRYISYMNIEDMKKIKYDKAKHFQLREGKTGRIEDLGYGQVLVKCKSYKDVEDVIEKLELLGYENINSPMVWLKQSKEMAASLQFFVALLGVITLAVSAIGIANTMVMSIYERTKEIGVMKVIGASIKDIKKLFLTEAAFIGFFGGVFGLLLSLGASYALNNFGLSFMEMFGAYDKESIVSIVPLWLCGLGILFSTVVGLVSGYLPARRATQVSALTAIRSQ